MTRSGQALDEAVRRLADGARAAGGSAGDGRRQDLIHPLLLALHDAAMRVATDGADQDADALAHAAAVVREVVPEGADGGIAVRPRVFIRLLRADALRPARTLAADDASGVLRPARAVVMWAGGSRLTHALPLPTLAERGHVYAWLPGFRDPRWGVPDEVYDITDDVTACVRLERLSLTRGRLLLGGTAYLSEITARADDEIVVVLSGPGGTEHRAPAVRTRTPDRVEPTGPELTRLAWAGWYADVDLTGLAGVPGSWTCRLTVAQGDVRRTAGLGTSRGPFAQLIGRSRPQEAARRVFRLVNGPDGQLMVTVTRLGPRARWVPRPARAALRRIIPGR